MGRRAVTDPARHARPRGCERASLEAVCVQVDGSDLAGCHDLDVGDDVVPGAEVEHLLRLPGSAGTGPGQAASPHRQSRRHDIEVVREPERAQGAIELESPHERCHGVGLLRGGREGHDLGAERPCELDRKMAESPDADDANGRAGSDVPATQRRERRHAGAKQRCGAGPIEALRHLVHEALVADRRLGVPTSRAAPVLAVDAVVGRGRTGLTIRLQLPHARIAGAAGVDDHADADDVALGEAFDLTRSPLDPDRFVHPSRQGAA
ncbi:MAG: hypothetical protein JWR63_1336 [Conexibacter sp.]|nr:hypothetical protein [Conexibacter sp.]